MTQTDSPKTLLLVDDDAEVLAATRRALAREGYELLWTTSPHVACAMLEREVPIDLLISDIDMPEMNGLDLVAFCREKRPDVIRMIVSGKGTVEAVTRALNEGEVHRFIHKPFAPADLRRIVASALRRQPHMAQTARAERIELERRRLLDDLETAYPGITDVSLEPHGTYRVEPDSLADITREVWLTDESE